MKIRKLYRQIIIRTIKDIIKYRKSKSGKMRFVHHGPQAICWLFSSSPSVRYARDLVFSVAEGNVHKARRVAMSLASPEALEIIASYGYELEEEEEIEQETAYPDVYQGRSQKSASAY